MASKILLISNLYPSSKTPYYGSFVKNFEDQLRAESCVEKLDTVFLSGFHTSKIVKIGLYLFFYIKIFIKSLFGRYDLIYVHLISHSTLPLRIVNSIKRLPLVFNIHGEDLLVTTPLSAKMLKLALPTVKTAKALVVPSYYFKKIVEERIPEFDRNNIIVSASGGVKKQFFIFPKTDPKEFWIGYVSRIDRGKGWRTLIEAIKQLEKGGFRPKVLIAGGGPQKDELLELISSSMLTNIEYVGPIAHDELPTFYSKLNCFVFPTELRESLGLVGLEAMAAGCPIIGSKIGGLTDYIEDGENGFFFEPGNEVDLASKIKIIMSLPDGKRADMSKKAVATALKYEATTVARTLFDHILHK